jgi:hypothetical protein
MLGKKLRQIRVGSNALEHALAAFDCSFSRDSFPTQQTRKILPTIQAEVRRHFASVA